jgi:hypothetical protein
VVTGTGALVTIVALWGLHFASSGRLMDRYVETTSDPILGARRTVNGLLASVASLIAVAVGNELVVAHPQGQARLALSLALFGARCSTCCRRPPTCGWSSARGHGHGWPASPRSWWPAASPTCYRPTQPWHC